MKTLEALLREGSCALEVCAYRGSQVGRGFFWNMSTGRNRAWYFAHSDEPADEQTQQKYMELCRKRREHIPLQHLTGSAWFMGYDFFVDQHVLVPRQDTECLVEEGLKLLKGRENPRSLICVRDQAVFFSVC